MRRRTGIAAAAAIGAMGLALSSAGTAAATAAQRVLIVDGTAHQDPSGCYEGQRYPLAVTNHTDGFALVFSGPGCQGDIQAGASPSTDGRHPRGRGAPEPGAPLLTSYDAGLSGG
ncbi:hypothetical protein [Streptomyces cucumeris]|uniref:hypothetical protein n=1 Tax=Streptomyces cucumeris TaxID=2962890 RepID=UPI003D73E769